MHKPICHDGSATLTQAGLLTLLLLATAFPHKAVTHQVARVSICLYHRDGEDYSGGPVPELHRVPSCGLVDTLIHSIVYLDKTAVKLIRIEPVFYQACSRRISLSICLPPFARMYSPTFSPSCSGESGEPFSVALRICVPSRLANPAVRVS